MHRDLADLLCYVLRQQGMTAYIDDDGLEDGWAYVFVELGSDRYYLSRERG